MKNLFGNIFGKKSADSVSDKAQPQAQLDGKLSDAALEKIIEEIKAETSVPCMKLVLKDGAPGLTDSKLGGLPYIPHDGTYPADAEGRQLKLLAQINLKDVVLPDFPGHGLLQFFIATNRLYGLNTASPTAQTGFSVKYFEAIDETVTEDEVKAKTAEPDDSVKIRTPLEKEPLSVEFEATTAYISTGDFHFDKLLAEKAEAHCPDCGIKSLLDLSEEQQQKLSSIFTGNGSKISGFPHFAQDDPRCVADKNLQGFETLLLQLDSDGENIDWGDSGTGNFFIEPSALKASDFSKVLYNWDCL